MTSAREIFPGGWAEVAPAIAEMRSKLFGVIPDMPATDFSELCVPEEALLPILEKNRRAIRDEIGFKEFTAPDSPFRTHEFFDDQLVEVLFSIQSRYSPSEFISQLVWLVHQFLSESAALRASVVQDRMMGDEGEKCVMTVLDALSRAETLDERATLELLLMELTEGGDEPWVNQISEELRARIRTIANRM